VPEALGQEIDVEARLVLLVLLRREEIEEQGGEARAAQLGRDELVTRRVAAGTAPVREDDDPRCSGGQLERAFQRDAAGRDRDERLVLRSPVVRPFGARARRSITSSSSTCPNSR
jgi:hypothetical protein